MALVLDAGALIALDKRYRTMRARLEVAATERVPIRAAATAVAQAWRDGPRQANLARLLEAVEVLALGPNDARRTAFDFPPVDKDKAFDIIDAMRPMADARGVSVAQIALSWLLHQKHVTSVIIGAKTEAQLSDNIAATKVELSSDDLARLDDVSKLKPEYPGWMLERQGADRTANLS